MNYYVRIPLFAVAMGLILGGIALAATQTLRFGLYVFGLTTVVLLVTVGAWIVKSFDSHGRPRDRK
jgi:uncharacterized protein (DUF58 family)